MTRLSYSTGSGGSAGVFVVGHLRQTAGGTILDDPSDFHFFLANGAPTVGEVEAVIDRQVVAGADELTISWVLAPSAAPGPILTYPVTP